MRRAPYRRLLSNLRQAATSNRSEGLNDRLPRRPRVGQPAAHFRRGRLMSQHRSDAEIVSKTHNTARFFVETRHVAWVLLIATCLWGVYGYLRMPQRKDPEVQVRTAVALTPWRGASAEKVVQLVTKKVETQMAANARVTKIESISRTGLSVVYLDLDENLKETRNELEDIKLKLDGISDLPSGAGPIKFIKDFG